MHVEGGDWSARDLRRDAERMRAGVPLVHCLTNLVSMPLVANALLAVGASPAMIVAGEEAPVFAARADALLVNVGTLTVPTADAMRTAVAAARKAGRPWVLDPVGVGGLPLRDRVCHELLRVEPAIVRGNGSEVLALAGEAGGGRGVDSVATSNEAVAAARRLHERTGAVVAVSGAVDQIVTGERTIRVHGGDERLTQVTGTGDALGALMAAFAGCGLEATWAAVAGCAAMAVAAERAAARSAGPGSFAPALLDELAQLDA